MAQNTRKKLSVYTPESPLKNPGQLFAEMGNDLKASFGLAVRLTLRDIAAQYRQTALGYFWAVFPPLVTSLTFLVLQRAKIFHIEAMTVPYPLFLITGTIFWQLFVDALNAPLKVMIANHQMLSKINFPKEALILSAIAQTLFSLAIKLILLAIILLIFQVSINWTLTVLFVPIFGLLCFGILCGILITPLGMLYHDVQRGLLFVTSILMFFTPVLYPPPASGILGKIVQFNPLSPLLHSCRNLIFQGSFEYLGTVLIEMVFTLVFLLLGWIAYRVSLPILIERMEA